MSGTDYDTTPNLGLFKPRYDMDDEQWGAHLNQNADMLDAYLSPSGSPVFLPIAGGVLTGPLTVPKLNISAIPTSATGLVHGDVWSNGGVLMVVP